MHSIECFSSRFCLHFLSTPCYTVDKIMGRLKKKYRITLRNNGIYYVLYPGHKWQTTGQIKESDARAWADYNLPGNPNRMPTVAEFARDFFIPGKCKWLKRMKQKGHVFGQGHLKKMRANVENYIIKEFGNLSLNMVTRRSIDDWLLDLKGTKSKRPLMADAKNKIIVSFRHIMNDAVDEGWIEKSPLDDLVPFNDLEKAPREIFTVPELKMMFPDDLAELDRIWQSLEWATYFYIMGSCGLRPGEASALVWGNWYKDLHGLVITHSIEAITLRRKNTKTGIMKPAILTAKAEMLLQIIEDARPIHDRNDLIFPGPDGTPMILETANKHFKASVKRAGIDLQNRTQYCLRHSFNTYARKELDSREVLTLMGHSNEQTNRIYDHPEERDILERLSEETRDKARVRLEKF